MGGVEGEGLVEGIEGAGDFFVWEEAGEAEAGVVIDGDVKGLDACVPVALCSVARGADARLGEAAEFLDVEVKEVAWMIAFVADGRGFWRFEGGEAVEAVAAENARKCGGGNWDDGADLGVGAAVAAEF